MTVTARMDRPGIAVEPGEVATVDITVHNDSRQVEAYHLDLVGEPAAWASIDPPELSIYPGSDAHALVRFAPPRGAAVTAGPRAFGVRVMPVDHPEETVVPEGTVELRPFADLSVELTPRTSHGRGRARHELAIDNRGNTPVRAALTGRDPDEAVVVRTSPAELVVGPGQAAFARVRVSPARRRWTGPPLTHPFQVAVTPDSAAPLVADGTMLADPLLPRGLGKALAALLVLALAGAAAWFGLLRPAVRSAAQQAVRAPVAAAQAQAGQAGQVAGEAKSAADKAAADTGALGKELVDEGVVDKKDLPFPTDGTPPPSTQAAPPAPAPFSRRLTVEVAGSQDGTADYRVPTGRTVSITDLIYENPQGDSGSVTVRSGDQVYFRKGLANFRDLPDHFVSPIVLTAGQAFTVEVSCATAGSAAPAGSPCRTAVILLGTVATTA